MIKVSWIPPTKFTSGRAVKAGDISGYVLKMRVEGAPNFTEIAKPAAAATSFELDANDPGKYEFELYANSSNSKSSAAGKGSVTITESSALEPPVVSVTLV